LEASVGGLAASLKASQVNDESWSETPATPAGRGNSATLTLDLSTPRSGTRQRIGRLSR
jgi:hypothetical protein